MTTFISDLHTRILRTIEKQHLFSPGDTIIVALSGGADSTALLHILAAMPGFPVRLVVAHLNHCLRGPESDLDEYFSRLLAERYNLPFECRRIDVKALADTEGLNLEDAGRRARTDFFAEIRAQWGATAIALAHHRDDQVETVLMRLLRGSGMSGLKGMGYKNDRFWVRPLLDLTRTEIETYLRERGMTWREDASNNDTSFLRNRVRHELVPLLESYTPALRERLAATAALLSDENDLLEQLTAEAEKTCQRDIGRVSCSIFYLRQQHPALQRRILRRQLCSVAGTLDHFTRRHIDAIEQMIGSQRPNTTLNLPNAVTVSRAYDNLFFRRNVSEEAVPTTIGTISGAGCHTLPDGNTMNLSHWAAPPEFSSIDPATAFFDLDKAPFPWHVRYFQNGDRMTPLGMSGSKKIKDIFIDRKIPLSQRKRIPLLFSGTTLIWICGLCISDLARVDSSSTRIVKAVL